jgi:hypothetical protein
VGESGYYRFGGDVVRRSAGHSSVAAAAYQAAEQILDERTGEVYRYRRKQHVYGSEILAPANAPDWVYDRKRLWNENERREKRHDSQLARLFVLSFPACMTHEQKMTAARLFLQRECVSKGMIADVAYHDFTGKDAHNPHAHVLLTMRDVTAQGFAQKNRSWNSKDQFRDWRKKWADHLNVHLEQGGHQQRVDHRSYQDQGIDRTPTRHEGRAVAAIRRANEKAAQEGKPAKSTWLIDHNDEIKRLNAELLEDYRLLKEMEQTAEQDNAPVKRIAPETMAHSARTAAHSAAPKPAPEINPHDVTAAIMKLHQEQQAMLRQEFSDVVARSVREAQTSRQQEPVAQQPAVTPQPQPQPVPQNPPVNFVREPRKKGKDPGGPKGRTWYAIRAQLDAMGGNGEFEIGILDRNHPDPSKAMTERTWRRDQILRFDPQTRHCPVIGFLKGENVRGKEIYIRPARLSDGRSQGLILVDDIDQVTIEDMKTQGLQPAVVIETSHRNCQAWLKIAPSLSREESTQAAKILAQQVGGDRGSAGYQHYGRLAGFTNRKDEHQDRSGRYPWVKVLEATGQAAGDADHVLALTRQEVERVAREQDEAKQYRVTLNQDQATADELEKAAARFLSVRERSHRQFHLKDDSTLDWVAVKLLAKEGCKLEALEHALWHSPGLEQRKPGHEQNYVTRTVEKVLGDPDVLMALHRRAERRRAQEQKQASRRQRQDDQRKRIDQFQQFKDRERGSRASSSTKEQMKQPGGERSQRTAPSPGEAQQPMIRREEIPVHALGEMDTHTVDWIIQQTLEHPEAQRQFAKAAWALTQNTSHWKNQCSAEYLKELARCMRVKRALAHRPHTDAEIALKLRMAGFSKQAIAKTLMAHSPFVQHMDADQRTIYVNKGIAPVVNHPQAWRQVDQFQQMRITQARALPEEHRDAYLQERRLEQLKLSTTKERWEQQTRQNHPSRHQEPEHER